MDSESIDRAADTSALDQNDPEVVASRSKEKSKFKKSDKLPIIRDDYTFYAHGKKHYFSSNSLGILSNKMPLRQKLVWVVTWKWFEYFITICILANSAFLGIMDYKRPEADIWQNQLVSRSENIFTAIFVLECVMKILAMGLFIGKGSYLRNAWNLLDFTVVVTSLLALTPTMNNISGLRTFRLFRPLRNLTTVPSMRTLVGTLLQSMAQLGGVLSLAIFFFLIFAILGVSLWSGTIHYRCWQLTPNPETGILENTWTQFAQPIALCQSTSQCSADQVCDSFLKYQIDNNFSIGKGEQASELQELNWGITNFDNIFSAFLTIFQCITMEGWTEIMYIYMDAYNSLIVVFYYVFCVVVCSLFLLNMTIAVMLHHYEELDKKEADTDYTEIIEQGNKAKLPSKLITFIIENDMCVKKPKKDQEDEQVGVLQKVKIVLQEMPQCPNESYYGNKFVRFMYKFSLHPLFSSFIMLIIISNTIVLALDKYPEHSEETETLLSGINLAFTIIFTLEVVFKLIALRFGPFCKERFNIFDLVIVLVSLIEISLQSDGGSFGALRAFRLFRIIKLFRVGDLRVLVDSIAYTVTTIGNYVILLLLFIYVYALLGMQFFAGKLEFDPQSLEPIDSSFTGEAFVPRANFDSLINSCLTIFEILIGDNWPAVMYDCIRTQGASASAYFITLILFGNIIMLNLFLAILLGNFDRARLYQVKMKIVDTFKGLLKRKMSIEEAVYRVFPELPPQMARFLLGKKALSNSAKLERASTNQLDAKINERAKTQKIKQRPKKQIREIDPLADDSRHEIMNQTDFVQHLNRAHALKDEPLTRWQQLKKDLSYRSLFIFHMHKSKVRQLCLTLVNKNEDESTRKKGAHDEKSDSVSVNKSKLDVPSFVPKAALGVQNKPARYFESCILFLILLSSLSLALDNPLYNPQSTYKQVLWVTDQFLTFAFTIELVVKVIALGFAFNRFEQEGETGRQPYIRSAWNVLDFIVVVASLFDFIVYATGGEAGNALKSIKALRALRALRPLRVISKNEGLRLVVNALLSSLPAMTNVLMVCALFLLIFAIMGINFFKGGFYSCSLEDLTLLGEVSDKQDCINLGGEWKNSRSNFDNIFEATLCLFEMMTTEGWLSVMYLGTDTRGIDKQPQRDAQRYNIIFFVAFMIIGSQFILNLFVGIVIDNFNKIKEKELGNIFLTEQQKTWVNIQRFMLTQELRVKHQPPENSYRLAAYKLVKQAKFDYFITTCIFANTIIMAMKYYTMSDEYEATLDRLNYGFAAVFNVEAILKLTALGKKYFYEQWNVFDFVIVIGTNTGILVSLVAKIDISTAASVIRGFRIMRIFRLIRSARNIKVILDTVVKLLPQITNIMLLIFLLFFIYAALGINLFSGVKYQTVINSKNNFRTFENSLLVLMRCATGEDWNLIMHELTLADDGTGTVCKSEQTYEEQQRDGIMGCGIPALAYFYFISFMIIISMLIMNLSVATVIEGLNSSNNQNSGLIKKDDTEAFLALWMEYDQKASGWMPHADVCFFLYELPSPFTIKDLEKGQYFEKSYLERRDFLNRLKSGSKQSGEWQKEKFLVNEGRNLFILKADALNILKVIELPVYSNGCVHFKDVYKKVAKNVMAKNKLQEQAASLDNGEHEDDDYRLGQKLRNRLQKEWAKKHKVLKSTKKEDAFQNENATVSRKVAIDIITQFIRRNRAKFNQPIDQKKKKNKNKTPSKNRHDPRLNEAEEVKDAEKFEEREQKDVQKSRWEKNRQEQKWLYHFEEFNKTLNQPNYGKTEAPKTTKFNESGVTFSPQKEDISLMSEERHVQQEESALSDTNKVELFRKPSQNKNSSKKHKYSVQQTALPSPKRKVAFKDSTGQVGETKLAEKLGKGHKRLNNSEQRPKAMERLEDV